MSISMINNTKENNMFENQGRVNAVNTGDLPSPNVSYSEKEEEKPKRKYGVRLKRAKDVRRYLAKKLREYEDGMISTERIKTITYVCNTLLSSINSAGYEERIKTLEKLVNV